MLTALTLMLAAAPTGTLTLDRADPIVMARIDDVPLRLRITFDQHAVVELMPQAVARLPMLAFEPDGGVQIGRIALSGRVARATLTIQGRATPITVSSYAEPCCLDVDGEIPPDLLPFAEVRLTGPAAATPTVPITLRMEREANLGLFTRAATPGGPVLALFTLRHDATLATAAGAAALVRAGGGRFTGTAATEARAFGIPRPVHILTLDRPVAVAGFRIDHMLVRTADFRGDNRLPPLPDTPDTADIRVTARRAPPQRAIPAITLGRDLLSACPDIRFTIKTRLLTLFCTRP